MNQDPRGGPEARRAGPGAVADGDGARRAVVDLAMEAAGIGTFDLDLASGRLEWDERLVALFGYDRGEEFDRSMEGFYARLHPDDVGRVRALVDDAIDRVGEYAAEYRVVTPGGDTRWVAARGRVLGDAAGRAARLVGVATDTTATRDQEARVARVMDSLSTAFFALDVEWRFSYVNSEAERVLGRKAEELIGGKVWDLFPAAVSTDFELHYRRATESGEPVAFDAYYPEPLNAWYEVRAWPNPDGLAVYFLDVTARRRAQEAADRAVARASLLADVSERLAGTLDADEAARRLARVVVPVLGEWSVVGIVGDDQPAGSSRGLRRSVGWHADPGRRELVERYARERLEAYASDDFVVTAIEANQVQVFHSDVMDAVRERLAPGPVLDMIAELDPYAAVVLPLVARGSALGMLTVCRSRDQGGFSSEDLATAREVAARAGLVLDGARLYRQQRRVAEALQRSALTSPPSVDKLDIAVRYCPAAEATQIGGDWYDAVVQPGGAVVLVIGDAMGHDLSAAAAMSQIRTLVRGLAVEGDDGPAAVLQRVDRVMRGLAVPTTATALAARVQLPPASSRGGPVPVAWSSAGHPPCLIVRSGGAVELASAAHNDPLLGVTPDMIRQEHTLVLHPGDTMLLYTDGLVERRDQAFDSGLERLVAVAGGVAGSRLESFCDQVLSMLVTDRPEDDVALIAVRYTG